MEPYRIIFHPAPSPTPEGEVLPAEPIPLPTDPRLLLPWLIRRLGLSHQRGASFATTPLDLSPEERARLSSASPAPRRTSAGSVLPIERPVALPSRLTDFLAEEAVAEEDGTELEPLMDEPESAPRRRFAAQPFQPDPDRDAEDPTELADDQSAPPPEPSAAQPAPRWDDDLSWLEDQPE